MVWSVVLFTRWWLLVDHCVLRNWDRILVRSVKGLISRAGMVSICPLLWQRDVKLQQTKPKPWCIHSLLKKINHDMAIRHALWSLLTMGLLQSTGGICLQGITQYPIKWRVSLHHYYAAWNGTLIGKISSNHRLSPHCPLKYIICHEIYYTWNYCIVDSIKILQQRMKSKVINQIKSIEVQFGSYKMQFRHPSRCPLITGFTVQ